MRSLAERMRAFEQQKARLADTEAKLRTAEKKAHTKRLIEIGSLVEKAGFEGLATAAIYGALLALRSGKNDKQIEQWTQAGSRALAEDAVEAGKDREAVILVFPGSLNREATSILRSEGFRFNKFLQHWEGVANFGDADELAVAHGGTAKRVSQSGFASSE